MVAPIRRSDPNAMKVKPNRTMRRRQIRNIHNQIAIAKQQRNDLEMKKRSKQ